MKLQTPKAEFMLNKKNKQRFIDLLSINLTKQGIDVTQCKGDADVSIVNAATSESENTPVCVDGEDTDLLVYLLHYIQSNTKVFLASSKSSTKTKTKIYDIQELRHALGDEACKAMPVIHAILGCDTTSRIFSVGKASALRKVFIADYYL